jgi:hypothetical protein
MNAPANVTDMTALVAIRDSFSALEWSPRRSVLGSRRSAAQSAQPCGARLAEILRRIADVATLDALPPLVEGSAGRGSQCLRTVSLNVLSIRMDFWLGPQSRACLRSRAGVTAGHGEVPVLPAASPIAAKG